MILNQNKKDTAQSIQDIIISVMYDIFEKMQKN